jgi:hypothetical protein
VPRIRVELFGTSYGSRRAQDAELPDMKYKRTRTGITRQDLAQDRAFWRDLLARRTSLGGLPAHSAGGYRNRRFAIVRDAVWITLYRARLPFPQVGVFLRCAGIAGEAFFTLADRARPEIVARLRAELGPDAAMEWGVSHHPGMTDIAAILAAPLSRTTVRPNSILHGCFGSAPRGGIVLRPWQAVPGGEQYLPREAVKASPSADAGAGCADAWPPACRAGRSPPSWP